MSAGGTLNIDPSTTDPKYRYKMDPLITKVEGRGNGIKTVIMNVTPVARQLHTVPEWMTKFFGIDRGAQSRYDTKRGEGVAIVNGVHTAADLQTALYKYITDFILCPKCRLPELEVRCSVKKSVLGQRCASCGYQGANKSVHRVKTYMISHPPPKSLGRLGGADSKKKKKSSSKKKALGKVVDDQAAIAEEGWKVEIDDESVRQRKIAAMKSMGGTSSKKVSSKEIAMITDRDSPVGVLRLFVLTGERSVSDMFDELKRIQMAHALDETSRMKVTMEALLDPTTVERFTKTLSVNKELFKLLNRAEGSAQRFFSCLEEVICRRNYGQLLPKANPILLALYKEGIVTAEDIVDWWDSPADSAWLVEKEEAQRLRDAAESIAQFCREMADEESDESEYETDSEEKDDSEEVKED